MAWLNVAELEARLGASDPGTYTQLLTDGQAFLEGQIGWPLGAESRVEVYDGPGHIKLVLRRYPVLDVADVTDLRVDSDGDFTAATTAVSDFTLQLNRHLVRRGGEVFPRGVGNVRVTYTAGYPDDHAELDDLKSALTTLIRHWLDTTVRTTGAVKKESIGTYSYELGGGGSVSSDSPTGLPEVDAVIARWRGKRRPSIR